MQERAAPVVSLPGESQARSRTERLKWIFEHNYRLVWRVVRRLGVPADDADDAAQQVFLIAAERLDDIVEGSERAFVFGTAIRVACTIRRKLVREVPSEEGERRPSPLPRPDQLAEQKRAREILDRVLGEMPVDLRTVFVLFEFEGMTTPEIAQLLTIPVGTAASRLRRARERFHECVQAMEDAWRGACAGVRAGPHEPSDRFQTQRKSPR